MTQSNITKKRVRGYPSPDKTLAFCQKRTSTLPYRKMRSRPRLRSGFTQRPCFRVSSSCTLYDVFGNFAWRSAPPRKRVAQLGKVPALRDREVPPAGGSRRGARLRGNGDRGTSLREGVSFTPPLGGLYFYSFPGDSSLMLGMTTSKAEKALAFFRRAQMTQNNDKMRKHFKRSGFGTKQSLFCRRQAIEGNPRTPFAYNRKPPKADFIAKQFHHEVISSPRAI